MRKIGNSVTFGIEYTDSATGSKTSPQKRTSPSVTPIQRPTAAAIAKPTPVAASVAPRLSKNQPADTPSESASTAWPGVAT